MLAKIFGKASIQEIVEKEFYRVLHLKKNLRSTLRNTCGRIVVLRSTIVDLYLGMGKFQMNDLASAPEPNFDSKFRFVSSISFCGNLCNITWYEFSRHLWCQPKLMNPPRECRSESQLQTQFLEPVSSVRSGSQSRADRFHHSSIPTCTRLTLKKFLDVRNRLTTILAILPELLLKLAILLRHTNHARYIVRSWDGVCHLE
jgi:hypothetical protein